MNKKKLTVGQTLFFEVNNTRGKISVKLVQGTVKKIGHKYFTVDSEDYDVRNSKFSVENMAEVNENYTSKIFGYFSEQGILDKREVERSLLEIRDLIGKYGEPAVPLNVEQVRSILQILKSTESN